MIASLESWLKPIGYWWERYKEPYSASQHHNQADWSSGVTPACGFVPTLSQIALPLQSISIQYISPVWELNFKRQEFAADISAGCKGILWDSLPARVLDYLKERGVMYNASANSVKTQPWSVSRTCLKAILTVWKVKVQNNLGALLIN